MHLPNAPTVIVITDTNILINLMHIGQLSLLKDLPGYQFQIPQEVMDELTEAPQKEQINTAIALHEIDIAVIETLDALALLGELSTILGRGEAACLALAATQGYHLASDEKKRFRRKAIELIGDSKILRTEDLLRLAIKHGVISLAQADTFIDILAQNRYVVGFSSFAT